MEKISVVKKMILPARKGVAEKVYFVTKVPGGCQYDKELSAPSPSLLAEKLANIYIMYDAYEFSETRGGGIESFSDTYHAVSFLPLSDEERQQFDESYQSSFEERH